MVAPRPILPECILAFLATEAVPGRFKVARACSFSDSFKQHARRFVSWVLGRELAGEGFSENGLP